MIFGRFGLERGRKVREVPFLMCSSASAPLSSSQANHYIRMSSILLFIKLNELKIHVAEGNAMFSPLFSPSIVSCTVANTHIFVSKNTLG